MRLAFMTKESLFWNEYRNRGIILQDENKRRANLAAIQRKGAKGQRRKEVQDKQDRKRHDKQDKKTKNI